MAPQGALFRIVSLKMAPGAGEMTLQLVTLSVLLEDPGFDSQHPHNSAQPSVTTVPGNSILSFGLFDHQTPT